MNPDLIKISQLSRQAAQRKNWPMVSEGAARFIALAPELPEGYFLNGIALRAGGDLQSAVENFEQSLNLDSARYDAAIELASILVELPDADRAVALLQQYAPALTNSPKYLDMAGTAYAALDLPDKAWPLYMRALELQPEIDLFRANLASCAVYLGKIDEAEALYRELLAKHPDHQRNHYHLSRLRTVKDDAHIRDMLATLDRTRLPPERNVFLYFALGKEYEDMEDWRHAFSFFKRGGDAIRRVSRYSVEEDLSLIDTVLSASTQDWLSDKAAATSDRTPVFVLGLPRTGSTLTERIISSHSQVRSIGETRAIELSLKRLSGISSPDRMNPEMIKAAARQDPSRLADEYLKAVGYQLQREPWFLEKLPYNFLYAGFISRAFPSARFVYVDRHPMDACFAMFKQVFTWAYQFSYSLDDLATYYTAHRRLLDYWRQHLSDQWITVSYEAMVEDQESETRRLLNALGLDFEPQCLDIQSNPAASTTASSVQIREAVHTRSVGRWRNYAEELEPLRAKLEAARLLASQPAAD